MALEKKVDQSEEAEIPAEILEQWIRKIGSGKDARELKRLNDELNDLRAKRALEPEREVASTTGYKQLRRGVSHIVDSLKMVVFEIETRLFEMLGPHYPNQAKEGRKLIVAALRTAGILRVEGDKIVVRLEAQASANRTQAIDRVCCELNALQATYPGTGLRIEFDTNR